MAALTEKASAHVCLCCTWAHLLTHEMLVIALILLVQLLGFFHFDSLRLSRVLSMFKFPPSTMCALDSMQKPMSHAATHALQWLFDKLCLHCNSHVASVPKTVFLKKLLLALLSSNSFHEQKSFEHATSRAICVDNKVTQVSKTAFDVVQKANLILRTPLTVW